MPTDFVMIKEVFEVTQGDSAIMARIANDTLIIEAVDKSIEKRVHLELSADSMGKLVNFILKNSTVPIPVVLMPGDPRLDDLFAKHQFLKATEKASNQKALDKFARGKVLKALTCACGEGETGHKVCRLRPQYQSGTGATHADQPTKLESSEKNHIVFGDKSYKDAEDFPSETEPCAHPPKLSPKRCEMCNAEVLGAQQICRSSDKRHGFFCHPVAAK